MPAAVDHEVAGIIMITLIRIITISTLCKTHTHIFESFAQIIMLDPNSKETNNTRANIRFFKKART